MISEEKRLETSMLHNYLKCVVLEGEYEGQEVDCSNAVNEVFGITNIVTGPDAPKLLVVEFKADGFPPIRAELRLKRRVMEVAIYERIG